MTAYSAGIQIAVIAFGQWSFSRHEERLSANAAGLSFAVTEPDGGVRLTASQPGYRNRIAVDLNAPVARSPGTGTTRRRIGWRSASTPPCRSPSIRRGPRTSLPCT